MHTAAGKASTLEHLSTVRSPAVEFAKKPVSAAECASKAGQPCGTAKVARADLHLSTRGQAPTDSNSTSTIKRLAMSTQEEKNKTAIDFTIDSSSSALAFPSPMRYAYSQFGVGARGVQPHCSPQGNDVILLNANAQDSSRALAAPFDEEQEAEKEKDDDDDDENEEEKNDMHEELENELLAEEVVKSNEDIQPSLISKIELQRVETKKRAPLASYSAFTDEQLDAIVASVDVDACLTNALAAGASASTIPLDGTRSELSLEPSLLTLHAENNVSLSDVIINVLRLPKEVLDHYKAKIPALFDWQLQCINQNLGMNTC